MKKNEVITVLVLWVSTAVLWYFIVAFERWSLDPEEWGGHARTSYLILTIFTWVVETPLLIFTLKHDK